MGELPQQLIVQAALMHQQLFAATRGAVISLNTAEAQEITEQNKTAAGRLLGMAEEPASFFRLIQIGITRWPDSWAARLYGELLRQPDWIYNGLGFQCCR